jgi:hypothetical protein
MPVTAPQVQSLAIIEVGDVDDYRLTNNQAAVWLLYADKDNIAPRLRYLYFKRWCIDAVIAFYRAQIDTTLGEATLHYQQRVGNLLLMRKEVEDEITRVELRARSNRAPSLAPLANVTPELPPDLSPAALGTSYPDANGKDVQGDPYIQSYRRYG